MNSANYKDVLIKCTLVKSSEEEEVVVINPPLPFTPYGPDTIYYQGDEITNWSTRLDLDGKEVYFNTSCIDKHDSPGFLPSEVSKVASLDNTILLGEDLL